MQFPGAEHVFTQTTGEGIGSSICLWLSDALEVRSPSACGSLASLAHWPHKGQQKQKGSVKRLSQYTDMEY